MSTIHVPREFLSMLVAEATKSLCNKADDVTVYECQPDVDQFEQSLVDLQLACAAREAIMRARDAGVDAELATELLRLPVTWVLREMHHAIENHDNYDLDRLVRDVETLRTFTEWADANGLGLVAEVVA